ncbi:ELMO domain-containing protein 3 [Caerostris extrusa]|uniref:ELMO domain-containing protein 3 n=1 Tax=Caerostris extrusa TaxID=172846 RepID=A0AAV4UJ79_CAEEX|nr:ELMO domain-containing protein 3 [Caerostris extrusa]
MWRLSDEKLILSDVKKPAIFKHKATVDVFQAKQEIEIARVQWDQLGTDNYANPVAQIQTPLISCSEVVNYFRQKDMNQYLKCIKPVKQRKGFEVLKHWLTGPPKLNRNLIAERDLFFAIALCPFDTSDEVHIRVLQTLYKTLTDIDKDCPRYGKHWEELGFQGVDPGTDLRGVGFLEISLLSKHERQNFPFCTMGINITRIVVETMREEALNRECNKTMDIFEVTNSFYAGIFLRLFLIWREQKKTIMDSGYVIKDLTNTAKKNSSVIFKELFLYSKV